MRPGKQQHRHPKNGSHTKPQHRPHQKKYAEVADKIIGGLTFSRVQIKTALVRAALKDEEFARETTAIENKKCYDAKHPDELREQQFKREMRRQKKLNRAKHAEQIALKKLLALEQTSPTETSSVNNMQIKPKKSGPGFFSFNVASNSKKEEDNQINSLRRR